MTARVLFSFFEKERSHEGSGLLLQGEPTGRTFFRRIVSGKAKTLQDGVTILFRAE
jgi:hypothetical protein